MTTATRSPAFGAPASLDPMSLELVELVGAQDPDVAALMAQEADRQASTLELIASENHVTPAVMHAAGSWLTNKYAEGYPGKRYYGGCQFHDQIEDIARERAKKLFKCGFANVQPHCGANANIAAFMALLEPGDTVLSLPIKSGGHLSHGLKPNFSGTFYKIAEYGLDPATELLDYDAIQKIALETKPKMIICGYSAYPRVIDFARFRAIADSVGAFLMADIAHIAGLVATGVHPSPFPHAHVVTTTTHKTLRGPRGGIAMCRSVDAKMLDRSVFPGQQGGPLMHVIAGKAVAFGEALRPEFRQYAMKVVENAKALAEALASGGVRLVSGGTDNHLMLVDVTPLGIGGKLAEQVLDRCGITCNKNMIPFDERKPMDPSGIRLGTPALTTRGLGTPEMKQVAAWILKVLKNPESEQVIASTRCEVAELAEQFPVPAAKLEAVER